MKISFTFFNLCKWITAFTFIVATILLLSPKIASTSIVPWVLFLIGNIVWLIDMIQLRAAAWMVNAIFFMIWDCLIIWTRISNIEVIDYIQPLITIMERYT